MQKGLGFNMDIAFTSLYRGNFPEGLGKDDKCLLKNPLVAAQKALTVNPKCWTFPPSGVEAFTDGDRELWKSVYREESSGNR